MKGSWVCWVSAEQSHSHISSLLSSLAATDCQMSVLVGYGETTKHGISCSYLSWSHGFSAYFSCLSCYFLTFRGGTSKYYLGFICQIKALQFKPLDKYVLEGSFYREPDSL